MGFDFGSKLVQNVQKSIPVPKTAPINANFLHKANPLPNVANIASNITKSQPVKQVTDLQPLTQISESKPFQQIADSKPLATANAGINKAVDTVVESDAAKAVSKVGNIKFDDPTTFAGSVGDLIYTDNPKMRARAEELERDCKDFETRFKTAKKLFDNLEDKARQAMTKYLKARGFDSLDDLDVEVRRVATGQALHEWKTLRQRIGRSLAIEGVIETICGLATLGGLSVTGVLVAVGVISGPAGWAALGAIGTATMILGGIVFVGAILQAIDQDEKLRVCIKDLHKARAELRLSWNRVEMLVDWLIAFTTYMEMTQDPAFDGFDALFQKLERRDRWRWESSGIAEEMRQYDGIRGSWTGADP